MRYLLALCIAWIPFQNASAISRADVMAHAVEFSELMWNSTQANVTADCSSEYTSLYLDIYGVGGPHKGMAYDWGGWDTVPAFLDKISKGYGAGTHSSDGILSCTTGQDCSGFVSRCWETSKKFATATMYEVVDELGSIAELKAGDALNKAGSHVVLFDSIGVGGKPLFYESAGGNVRKAWYNGGSSWNYLEGYIPVRYKFITDETVILPGSPQQPIVVSSFPYSDERNTMDYGSSTMNVYSCAPDKGEWGPEVVYQLEFPTAGAVTATVECGPGIDIDLHLLTELDENTCIDRAHEILGPINVEAGTYFLSADSWSNSSGVSYPGPYALNITFVPSEIIPEEPPSASCNGLCGDVAPAGCGCGPDCVSVGDCCEDACAICGACEQPIEEEPVEEEPVEDEPVEEDQPSGEELEQDTPWVIDSTANEESSGPGGLGVNGFAEAPVTPMVTASEEAEGCHAGARSITPVMVLLWSLVVFALMRNRQNRGNDGYSR